MQRQSVQSREVRDEQHKETSNYKENEELNSFPFILIHRILVVISVGTGYWVPVPFKVLRRTPSRCNTQI